jgi:hypothetical protein
VQTIFFSINKIPQFCFTFIFLYRNTWLSYLFGSGLSKKIYLKFIYFFEVSLINPSVDMDLGLSIGKPNARSHTNPAKTPKALDTPNNTV